MGFWKSYLAKRESKGCPTASKPSLNPFTSSFTASCENGRQALTASFDLHRHNRRAHVFVLYQTTDSRNKSPNKLFDVLWREMRDTDTITVLVFDAQLTVLVSGQSKAKTCLDTLLAGCEQTAGGGAALWDAVAESGRQITSLLTTGTSAAEDNHFVVTYADGEDTTQTVPRKAYAAYCKEARTVGYCYEHTTCHTESSYWRHGPKCVGNAILKDWIARPGEYYTGCLQMKATGTSKGPSQVVVTSSHRTYEKLAEEFAKVTPHAVKQIGAEHMLEDALRNLKLTKMSITYS